MLRTRYCEPQATADICSILCSFFLLGLWCMCLWPQLSDQMVELFEACQQQDSDLAKKERCRTMLQESILSVYPGLLLNIQNYSMTWLVVVILTQSVFLTAARLYLTGSSMSGLGCRSSDADLCLVLKGKVSFFDCAQNFIQLMKDVQSQILPSCWTHAFFFSEKTQGYQCAL